MKKQSKFEDFIYDKKRYSKEEALKDMGIIGKFCFYTGVVKLYLSYQVWKSHCRWYHPFTWIIIICYGVFGFMMGIIGSFQELFLKKKYRENPYKNAPKYIIAYPDFVAEPEDNEQRQFAIAGQTYWAKMVAKTYGGIIIKIGDRVMANSAPSTYFIVKYCLVENKKAYICAGELIKYPLDEITLV